MSSTPDPASEEKDTHGSDAPARATKNETPVASAGQTLARSGARAIVWVAVARYGQFVVSLLLMGILGRLLTPEDFGLVAMSLVITGFVTILAESGISSTIVQHPQWDRADISTVFWWSAASGATLSFLTWFLADAAAAFYGDARVGPVLAVAGIGFTLSALNRIPTGILERDLNFRAMAFSDTGAGILSAVVAVTAALQGAGYWTLVIRELSLYTFRLISRLAILRWYPWLTFRVATWKQALGFSSGVTAFGAITYWARNADNLLIGKWLGSESLGYYSRAYTLMTMPQDLLTGVIHPVLHPLFQQHRENPALLYRAWLQIAHLLALISFSLMAALAVTAEETVRLVWGPAWDTSASAFRYLCVAGALNPVTATTGGMYLARGRSRELAILGAVNALIIVSCLIAGLYWNGIEGTAVGFSVASILIAAPTLGLLIQRVLQSSPVAFARAMAVPAVIAALVGLTAAVVKWLLAGMAAVVIFGACVSVCSVVWVVSIRLLDRAWLRSGMSVLPVRLQGLVRRLV
jgi:O-antigen/teichoic acid export membrane protein